MVLTDWTLTGTGTGALDAAQKYNGNSSLKLTNAKVATHNTFSAVNARMYMWLRATGTSYVKPRCGGTAYGYLEPTSGVGLTWSYHRLTFWYDLGSNTKFGRYEKWNDPNWTQIGTDTNFGAGAPAANSFYLGTYGSGNHSVWFDDVELWEAV